METAEELKKTLRYREVTIPTFIFGKVISGGAH